MADTADTAQEHARAAMDQLMRVSMITQQTLKFHRQTGMPKAVRLSEISGIRPDAVSQQNG